AIWPLLRQQGVNVHMAELAAGVQEPEVGAAVVGVGQLVHAVPVQVDDGGLPRGPGQEDGPALRRDGPVVGEVVVGDNQAVIAEQVEEMIYLYVGRRPLRRTGQVYVVSLRSFRRQGRRWHVPASRFGGA